MKSLFTLILAFGAIFLFQASPLAADDPAPVDVDSPFGKNLVIVYSVTGNTLKMAEIIQGITHGDLYQIETVEEYPVGDKLIPFAKKMRDDNVLPTIKGTPPDVSGYDAIFLGTPVWFHDLPAPTQVFLENIDFQGKTVIPFVTAGGGPGDIMATLGEKIRNAKLLEAKIVTRFGIRPIDELEREIDAWLKTLAPAPAP
ncbi:MAG: hypothetical protein LBO66_15485 [Deltaproteobacteria bacterium]|jgi:flavodoxin|nr:hypothetical protein [Deltaproteobacteria bacterium]